MQEKQSRRARAFMHYERLVPFCLLWDVYGFKTRASRFWFKVVIQSLNLIFCIHRHRLGMLLFARFYILSKV